MAAIAGNALRACDDARTSITTTPHHAIVLDRMPTDGSDFGPLAGQLGGGSRCSTLPGGGIAVRLVPLPS